MAGNDFIVRWSDWKGGNFGTLDPAYADRDQYSGVNIRRYNSGLIGPRAGLKPLPINWGGFPSTHPVVPGPYGFDVHNDELLLTLNDETMRIPFNDTPATVDAYDPYPGAASQFVRFAESNRVLYGLINGDLYRHDDDGSITNIPLPGGIKLSCLYRWQYWLIGVDAGNPSRLWHSTVTVSGPAPDQWSVNGYLDVGSNLPIETIRPIYNTLYCGKADGWWAVSGQLGEQAYVRQRSVANGPIDDRGCTVTTDNRILYWPQDAMPAWFNGDRVHLDDEYELTGFDTQFACDTVVATPTGQRLLMIGERIDQDVVPRKSGLLVHDSGKWQVHEFDMPIAGIALGDTRAATMLPEGVVFMIQRPLTVGDPVSIVSFETDVNRPAHLDDRWAAPTDAAATELVTAQLELPSHWEGQGRFVRVTSVTVQFRKWPSGVPGSRNELQCRVAPLGLYDQGTTNTAVKVWTEGSDRSDPAGSDDSVSFSFAAHWSVGFQVQFPVIRGVAIREVVANVEVRGTRR